jgi:hypothetical protein
MKGIAPGGRGLLHEEGDCSRRKKIALEARKPLQEEGMRGDFFRRKRMCIWSRGIS